MPVELVGSLPEFQSIINGSGEKLVVVDFYAVWCGPCKAISPTVESFSQTYATRARFIKVDVDDAEDVARHCAVSSMPTFHFYRNGRLVFKFSGADPAKLSATIEQYAPSASDVSFSGAGMRLGAPGADPPQASTAGGGARSSRDVAAAAAARRIDAMRAAARTEATADDVPQSRPSPPSTAAPADAGAAANPRLLRQMVDEMGFPLARAEKALVLTRNRGLEDAVEWCFEHADDTDLDVPLSDSGSSAAPPPKPLSPEEARRRANELSARARQKREREEKEAEIEREKNRMRSGKEIAAMKAKLEDQERRRAVEERRRQKREELAERQRVREMLESDKQRRREKFNMPPPPSSSQARAQATSVVAPTAAAAAGKIQFRLPDGSRIEGEFVAEQTIGDLIAFLTSSKPELRQHAVRLSQQYPRKVYSENDYDSSLGELNLLPRGALTVSLS